MYSILKIRSELCYLSSSTFEDCNLGKKHLFSMRPVTSLASIASHENSNNEDNIYGMVRQDDDGDINNTVDNYNVDNKNCMI